MESYFISLIQSVFAFTLNNLYIIIPALIISTLPAMALVGNRTVLTSRQSVATIDIMVISATIYVASAVLLLSHIGSISIPADYLNAISTITSAVILVISLNTTIYSAKVLKNKPLSWFYLLITGIYFLGFLEYAYLWIL